jgi:hypothetical protein
MTGKESLLSDTLETERSLQWGPYVFGGDKMRSACEKAASDALKTADELYERKTGTHWTLPTGGGRVSGGDGVGEVDMKEFLFRRGRERSNVRLGFGGSSMHLDGMGTMTAIGVVKHGMKLVTAVEACDAVFALNLVKFRLYAKPGGSSFLLNQPVDRVIFEDVPDSVKELWTRHGIRWGTFNIFKGDGYVIPAGIPHEFLNRQKSLSIAWNIFPRCDDCVSTTPSTSPQTLPRYRNDL